MKVRATLVGYYGGTVRQPGDVFEIEDKPKKRGAKKPDAFSEAWMEAYSGPSPAEFEDVEDEDDGEDVAYPDEDEEDAEDEDEDDAVEVSTEA